jgi:acetolactate synthase-1/2/3 large subunit
LQPGWCTQDRRVVAVVEDGCFMMNSQGLETAMRLGLDLTVIVLRDNAYGMIKWKQAHMGFGDFGLDVGNSDFVQYAAAYGDMAIGRARSPNRPQCSRPPAGRPAST